MQIAEFQQQVRAHDSDTQWEYLTTMQLVAHLTEEIGEIIRPINRIYEHRGDKEKHIENLEHELIDALWFLVKIANRYNIDLDAGVQNFIHGQEAEPNDAYSYELINGLKSLDNELSMAKNNLDLDRTIQKLAEK